MHLEELINQHYTALNENDKEVCRLLLTHRSRLASYSCEQVATFCHISRATLLRLCRKISLVSFSDLKLLLKEEAQQDMPLEFDLFDTYHALIDELKKFSYRSICERLYACKTIYIYGTGNEQKTLAEECKRIFLSAGKCVIDLFDIGEVAFMKPTFQAEDMFIMISLSGETKEGIQILQMLQQCDIYTISMTRLANNTISSMCNEHLYVATKVVETMDYELVSAFYVLLDLLFINYLDYQREVEACESKN